MKTREILFRGLKADGSSEWVYGDLVNCGGLKYIIPIDGPSSVKYLPKQDESYHTEIRAIAIKVIPETVGQFTGLTDKNGTRIYRGDKLINPKGGIGIIVWDEAGFALSCERKNNTIIMIPLTKGFLSNKEVIGNIHQR